MVLKNNKKMVLKSQRLMKEMKDVLYDKSLAQKFPEQPLYYVWRGVDKKDDLRYDITLIPRKMLGKEYIRTKGNRNSENYFELYTILKGKAIFLIQKSNPRQTFDTKVGRGKKEIVEDVIAIKAKKGDWISISPEYAVVMINPSWRKLKTGNWVSEKNQNIYQELEEMGGACYFYTKSGWIKNKNYKHIPEIRFEKPLKKMPKNLDYLKG